MHHHDYGSLISNMFDQYPVIHYNGTYFAVPKNEFEKKYKIKSIKNGRCKAFHFGGYHSTEDDDSSDDQF